MKRNDKRIIIFDLEMCCWDNQEKKTGEIIEIGLCEVDLERLEITRKSNYYVLPEYDEVSPFCESLTGISGSKLVSEGRDLESVLVTIRKKYGFNKMYYAWGRDDITLNNECRNKGISYGLKRYCDFASVFRATHGLNGISQIDAMKMYGLDFIGRQHTALSDAENLANLFIEVSKKLRG